MSPDAFIQMCLQFTYFKFVFARNLSHKKNLFAFRMYNKLVSTYESASIRRFHFGRVDNIRANTPEALEWARAMVDETGNISAAEKLRLFRQAMQAQTDLMIQVNIQEKTNKFQIGGAHFTNIAVWKIRMKTGSEYCLKISGARCSYLECILFSIVTLADSGKKCIA